MVLAQGVVAFDEWGHALGARVSDRRAQADTIPADHELAPNPRATLRQSLTLVLAASFLFGGAALLVRATAVAPAEDRVLAAATAPLADRDQRSPPPAIEEALPPLVTLAPAPPPLPPEPPTTVVLEVDVVDLPSPAPRAHAAPATAPDRPAARRARVAPPPPVKTKRTDIVRDNPF